MKTTSTGRQPGVIRIEAEVKNDKAMDRKRLVQKYYSRRSGDYDRQKVRTWKSKRGFGEMVFEELLDSFSESEDKPVLEACLGTGRASLPLLKKAKRWLVGLDLSREMLRVAEVKLSLYKERCILVMGDAEHLSFRNESFGTLICTSAMHYFVSPGRSLDEFSRILCAKGVFIYGDLTLHERDRKGFLNKLEKTVSPAHEGYLKPSEVKALIKSTGFHISSANTVRYRKPFTSLVEDKTRYFGVKPKTLDECVCAASADERKMYALDSDELTLYYTMIRSEKEEIL